MREVLIQNLQSQFRNQCRMRTQSLNHFRSESACHVVLEKQSLAVIQATPQCVQQQQRLVRCSLFAAFPRGDLANVLFELFGSFSRLSRSFALPIEIFLSKSITIELAL